LRQWQRYVSLAVNRDRIEFLREHSVLAHCDRAVFHYCAQFGTVTPAVKTARITMSLKKKFGPLEFLLKSEIFSSHTARSGFFKLRHSCNCDVAWGFLDTNCHSAVWLTSDLKLFVISNTPNVGIEFQNVVPFTRSQYSTVLNVASRSQVRHAVLLSLSERAFMGTDWAQGPWAPGAQASPRAEYKYSCAHAVKNTTLLSNPRPVIKKI
jgi:hypothetical protein